MPIRCITFFMISCLGFAQNTQIADSYFEQGAFKKALLSYQELYKTFPNNQMVAFKLVKTQQQLQNYTAAEIILTKLAELTDSPTVLIELGYNYQLQKNNEQAELYYNQALSYINRNPKYAYLLGRNFEDKSILKFAIAAYKNALNLDPELDLYIPLAGVYAEAGNLDAMFSTYLQAMVIDELKAPSIKRYLSTFITEDPANENNQRLRTLLLKKSQTAPNLIWNDMLSWLFVKQEEYLKAFAQEKALFIRQPESLNRLLNLGDIIKNAKQYQISKSVYEFVLSKAQDEQTKLIAIRKQLETDLETSSKSDYEALKRRFEKVLETYAYSPQTFEIQVLYAHFLAFYLTENETAISQLKAVLENPALTKFQQAVIKMELGDILVLDEKFNQALIYYTQVQNDVKNSIQSQEARFKVAKTSYYKGDFDWADAQLKILKSSTSQLIANDALDLKLLISDNRLEDSLQTALKQYAKADLLAFQNKPDKAISMLSIIINSYKTETIVDQALFKQAQLYEKTNQLKQAEKNYKRIINDYSEDILVDDAYYFLAQLYEKQGLTEQAKPLYEYIIFNHEDSIYFVDSRKRYRSIRGDTAKL